MERKDLEFQFESLLLIGYFRYRNMPTVVRLVLLHLWRVIVKMIRGFINIPLADLSFINLRHNNITSKAVGETRDR
jgi:hypothetical protein